MKKLPIRINQVFFEPGLGPIYHSYQELGAIQTIIQILETCYDQRNIKNLTIILAFSPLSQISVRLTDPLYQDPSYVTPSLSANYVEVSSIERDPEKLEQQWRGWSLFLAASFLVSVPVFLEAPLVRNYPWICLAITPFLAVFSWSLEHRSQTNKWGDLLWGFTLTWLAGAIYWGWFRWEPLIHLPFEAIGLPLAIWSLRRNRWLIGSFFYLGSLLGTAITDAYFYLVDLIPYWRSVMRVDLDLGATILQAALTRMESAWAQSWAIALIIVLLSIGTLPFLNTNIRSGHSSQIHWWAFSGAILCTLVVDGLFWFTAGHLSI